MHNYEPKIGELTFLPTVAERLDNGVRTYVNFQIGYIHQISYGKAIIFMPEVFYDTEKRQRCYENIWLILDYDQCNPVTTYGFNRKKWESEHPNAESIPNYK